MPTSNTAAVLNRLLTIVHRSLPMYLAEVPPWMGPNGSHAWKALAHIVNDLKAYSGRIADYLLDHHWRIELGPYPMEFTGLHDCSLDYLVGRLVELARRDIAKIEECVRELRDDPPARTLAEEVLGAARGHLEALMELERSVAAGPKAA